MGYNKYGNRKVVVDGVKFDSTKEANRFCELKLMQRGGVISRLQLQPVFVILDKGVDWEGKAIRGIKYKADFMYHDNEDRVMVVEDVKGYKTDVYTMKKKMFLSRYPEYKFIET
jgi:hypothetical protein